jgi:hypothetical protein
MQPHPDLSPIPDLDEDLITGLDNFIADHVHPEAGTLSRNDAINRILRDWLTGQGYVAPDAETLDVNSPWDGPAR